jgi:hypothetical protein
VASTYTIAMEGVRVEEIEPWGSGRCRRLERARESAGSDREHRSAAGDAGERQHRRHQPNRSEGALRIVDISKGMSLPYRRLAIATGGALTDVADANNAVGAWIAAKQPNLWHWSPASDQMSALAVGLPAFATGIERVSATMGAGGGTTAGPILATDQSGPDWLVTGM